MNVGNNTNCRMWHQCSGFISFFFFFFFFFGTVVKEGEMTSLEGLH